jgi:hypothetical protein
MFYLSSVWTQINFISKIYLKTYFSTYLPVNIWNSCFLSFQAAGFLFLLQQILMCDKEKLRKTDHGCLIPFKWKKAKNLYWNIPTKFAGSAQNLEKIIETPIISKILFIKYSRSILLDLEFSQITKIRTQKGFGTTLLPNHWETFLLK